MPQNHIDVLNEMGLYREALKTKNTVIASVIKERIIRYVCDLETENRRLNDENDPDAFLAVHMSAVAGSNEEVRELKAENDRLKEALELATFCTCPNPDGSYPHDPHNEMCNRDRIRKLIEGDQP